MCEFWYVERDYFFIQIVVKSLLSHRVHSVSSYTLRYYKNAANGWPVSRKKKLKTYAEKAIFVKTFHTRTNYLHILFFNVLSRSQCGTKLVLIATLNTFLKINIVRKIYPKL